jgi:hypothetical protein
MADKSTPNASVPIDKAIVLLIVLLLFFIVLCGSHIVVVLTLPLQVVGRPHAAAVAADVCLRLLHVLCFKPLGGWFERRNQTMESPVWPLVHLHGPVQYCRFVRVFSCFLLTMKTIIPAIQPVIHWELIDDSKMKDYKRNRSFCSAYLILLSF